MWLLWGDVCPSWICFLMHWTSFYRASHHIHLSGCPLSHLVLSPWPLMSSLLSCSILIVNRNIVSPTLHVNPTLFVIACQTFGGLYIYICLQLLSLTKCFFIQFHPICNHPWQYFITSCWQEKVGFWPMDDLIHHPWQYLVTYS